MSEPSQASAAHDIIPTWRAKMAAAYSDDTVDVKTEVQQGRSRQRSSTVEAVAQTAAATTSEATVPAKADGAAGTAAAAEAEAQQHS